MARYIDADALGIGKADRNVFNFPEYADGWNTAIQIIEEAPTADVAPRAEVAMEIFAELETKRRGFAKIKRHTNILTKNLPNSKRNTRRKSNV